MAQIELRAVRGGRSPNDLKLSVQDRTYDYLMSTISPEVRISAFFDADVERVEAAYAEVFVAEECPYEALVTSVIPGSRARKGLVLPGPMKQGEQLTIVVARKAKS